MNETILKIIKRFIKSFLQSHNFIEHRFVIIPIKDVVKLYGKMFKRVYGNDRKCVTSFSYVPFKCKSEQPKHNLFVINSMLHEKLKKMISVLKEVCFTLTIEFQIWQVINNFH